jgi:hypothetical protein
MGTPERDDPFRDAAPDESSERRDWDLPPEVEHGRAEHEGPEPPRRPQPPAEPDEPGGAG